MKQRLGHIITMLCAGLLLTLSGCSNDSSDDKQQLTQELRLTLGSPMFRSTDVATRAGELPASFEPYNYATSLQPFSQVQGYFAYEKEGSNYISCVFNHVSDPSHVWTSKVPLYTLDSGSSYYLYGFMPKENIFTSKENAGSGASIAPYGNPASYAKGAVITLSGLNTVVGKDICVIVGAKGYTGTTAPDMSQRLGKFDYDPETEGNNLFLLVDHIYAGLKFNMKLGTDYAALRGIKVKSMKLIPEDGDNNVIETIDAEVTIVANESYPMSVTFNNAQKGKEPEPAIIYDGEGKSLSTTSQEFMACFCPDTNTKFTLETKYDVYDRKGNLIREDQTARNAISLEYSIKAGEIHTVNITVRPTFLNVLSDPDLDNPTFKVN